MKATTSARLKDALKLKNIKQIDLSNMTGIPKSAISQYLSGKIVPKQDKIYLLAKALNVSELWLMGLDDTVSESSATKVGTLTSNEAEIILKYRVLDERGKSAVQSTIDREFDFIQARSKKDIERLA